MPHEIGHNLKLLHVDNYTVPCEYVDGSNASTAGDGVVDTLAAHLVVFASDCVYDNSITQYHDCSLPFPGQLYTNVPIKTL